MKIAIYYNLNFGGAKRVVFEQAKKLAKRHTIDIYKFGNDDDNFDPTSFTSSVYRYQISLDSRFLPFLDRLGYDGKTYFVLQTIHKKIAKEIDSKGYDIVLVHPDKFTQAPFLLRFLKTPSVYYCQEPLRIAYEYSLRLNKSVSFPKRMYEEVNRQIRKNIDRTSVRSATHTIASCYHVRERMIESYDVYPDINYPGIDTVQFRPKKVKKKNQVLFVGGKNVVTDGYDLAEKAVSLIPSQYRPKIHVVTWKKSNNSRLTDEELVTLYNESIAVLCVSRLETFGLVPLEAMACGIPVIATKVSGHRETIVDGRTGNLVEFSPREIALRLRELIDNPKKAKRMGGEGLKHVQENWTWQKSVAGLERLLNEYVAEK